VAQQINGKLELLNSSSNVTITIDGDTGSISANRGTGGTIFHFDSTYAALWLGGQGNEGDLVVRDQNNKERIKLDGGDGDIWVKDAQGHPLFLFDSTYAALYVGGQGNEGDVVVRDGQNRERIKLDGQAGDITLTNADVAEDFDVAVDVSRGTVMVLGDNGALEPSHQAYDRRVVGVIAGAGRYQPGMVLDRDGAQTPGRAPISVMGKVECLADASEHPIDIGDLLTTSPTPGHAMAATDTTRAPGAIIGKSLGRLAGSNGFIPMLVSLQ